MHNLVSLCSFHHHALHRGAFTIDAGPDGWIFTRADGRPIPPARPLGPADQPHPGLPPASAEATITPHWDGSSLQGLSGIVDGLLRTDGLLHEPPPPPPRPAIHLTPGVDADPAPGEPTVLVGASPWPDSWPDPWDQHPWPGE